MFLSIVILSHADPAKQRRFSVNIVFPDTRCTDVQLVSSKLRASSIRRGGKCTPGNQ